MPVPGWLSCCCFWQKKRDEALLLPEAKEDSAPRNYGAVDEGPYSVSHPDYQCYVANGFYNVVHNSLKFPIYGWKVHVSLMPTPHGMVSAWHDIIWPLVVKYEIRNAKIILSETIGEEHGKTITLYLSYNPELASEGRMQKFLETLEYQLRQHHHIEPGIPVANDIIFPGSNFLSYRCERTEHGDPEDSTAWGYITEREAVRIANERGTAPGNPFNHPDSYV